MGNSPCWPHRCSSAGKETRATGQAQCGNRNKTLQKASTLLIRELPARFTRKTEIREVAFSSHTTSKAPQLTSSSKRAKRTGLPIVWCGQKVAPEGASQVVDGECCGDAPGTRWLDSPLRGQAGLIEALAVRTDVISEGDIPGGLARQALFFSLQYHLPYLGSGKPSARRAVSWLRLGLQSYQHDFRSVFSLPQFPPDLTDEGGF